MSVLCIGRHHLLDHSFDPRRSIGIKYDPSGLPNELDAPDGTKGTIQYDLNGNTQLTIDKFGRVTGYLYDSLGRPTGTEMLQTANINGALLQDSSGNTFTESTTFDDANRVTSATDARGFTSQAGYDAADHLLTVTDPLQQVTSVVYDADGHAVSVKDPTGT